MALTSTERQARSIVEFASINQMDDVGRPPQFHRGEVLLAAASLRLAREI